MEQNYLLDSRDGPHWKEFPSSFLSPGHRHPHRLPHRLVLLLYVVNILWKMPLLKRCPPLWGK